MHDIDRGDRSVLRAKLLLGVASATAAMTSAALADQAPAAPPSEPDKWVPYVDIGGGVGSSMTAGKADAFVPIWQDLDSLLFLNLGIGTETKTNQFESFTAGYRSKINSDWILGGYVGFDSTQLQDTNTFNQTALGAELMSADWDVRLNGYLAANEVKGVSGDGSKGGQLYINGTTIAILDAAEVGYTGFDGEVGYRVFSTDDVDVRFFVGGFFFSHSDDDSSSMGSNFSFGYRDIAGPKGRAEATLYDLDLLGPQSRLSVDGEIAHDDVRGTTGFIGATLRIPLGDFGGGAQALDELDRRMIDPERRNDTVLTRAAYTKPEPVIIYGPHVTSQPTNTLLYVDNTVGAGTYANPTTFADAASRATNNAFIVLTSKQGPVVGGATLQAGQTVVAGGETFTVEGEFSHTKFTHLFDPSTNVTVVPSTAGGNVITLANDTSLYGFGITGDFGSAVYGKNVTGINLTNLTIDGTGGGVTGININRTESGDQTVNINNVAISNVIGDGVDIHSYITDGGTSSLTTTINNVTVTNASGDGLDIDTYAGGGSKIASAVSLSNVLIAGAGDDGIGDFLFAGHGSYINQTFALSGAMIANAGNDGILVDSFVQYGSTVNQTTSIANATVTTTGNDGILIDAFARYGSTVDQTTTIANATVTTTGNDGILIDAFASNDSTIDQTATITSATVANARNDGILIAAYAGQNSTINQMATLTGVTVVNSGDAGILIDAQAGYGSTLYQKTSIADAAITGADFYGILIEAFASNAAIVSQTTSVTGATITGTYNGIVVEAYAETGATAAQNVSITDTTITHVGGNAYYSYGLKFIANAAGAGSLAKQTATITGVTVSYAEGKYGGTAIGFDEAAYNGASVAQYVTIASSSGTHSGTGLALRALAYDYGAITATTAYQKVSVTGGNFSNNAYYGIAIEGRSGSFAGGYHSLAAVTQNLSIYNTQIDNNGLLGVVIGAYARSGASATQNILFYGVQIEHNAGTGVYIVASAETHAFVDQNIEFNNAAGTYNEISYDGAYGINAKTQAYTGGEINQHLHIYNTNVDHNTLDGIRVNNIVGGYLSDAATSQLYFSHLQQNLVLAYGSISNNGDSGVSITNTVNYAGSEDQFIELYKETIEHNFGSGFTETSTVTTYAGYGYSRPTNLHSNVYIYNSNLSSNIGSGISIQVVLHSPTYAVPDLGISYLEQHITVSGSTVSGNGGDGFYAEVNDQGVLGNDIQYITLAKSTFNYNTGNGARFIATQYYGPGNFGDAIQEVTISNSQFNHNTANGLYAYAQASGPQGRAEQHFTITDSDFDYNVATGMTFKAYAHDGVYVSGLDCGVVQGLPGGCAIVRQTVGISYSDISHNGGNGIYVYDRANNYGAVYNDSGRPASTPTLEIAHSTVNNNGNDGLYVHTKASSNSYVYSYVVALDSHVDHNTSNGIYIRSGAYSGSLIQQKTVLYGTSNTANTTASYNQSNGVFVSSYAHGGAVLQYIDAIRSVVSYNGSNGLSVSAIANALYGAAASVGNVVNPAETYVAQYLNVYGSNISGNSGYGIKALAKGTGAGTTSFQYLGVVDSTVSGNHGDGVHALASGYDGAYIGQNVYFAKDTITNNLGDGVYIAGLSVGNSSAAPTYVEQQITFGYAGSNEIYITGNHNNGVYISGAAFTGATITQSGNIYNVNASSNIGTGLAIGIDANGYGFGAHLIYYSTVKQYLTVANSTFDRNGNNGITVNNNAFYGGIATQSLGFYKVDASHNTGAGFYETSSLTSIRNNSFSFNTSVTSTLYLGYSTLNNNTTNGISIAAHIYGPAYLPAFFGGNSAIAQHTTITGSTADYNGGAGLLLDAHATGRYNADVQTVTITGSDFSHNTGDGARFLATSYYNPGSGPSGTVETISISSSHFDYNGGAGLRFASYASGVHGVAAQYVTITSSYADHNAGDGVHIYASAINGAYIAGRPCTDVQGTVGGCAVVRQSVSITGTDVSDNTGNGVSVATYANNYGAIYGKVGRPHSPTLYLINDTIDYNSGRGLNVSNHVTGNSYLYQYADMIDTHLDHNHSDGIYATSYVGGGSTLMQRTMLYTYHTGSSASYNAGNGEKNVIEALGGSYIRNVNIAEGANLSYNGSFGFDGAVVYADGTSTGLQINALYFNAISHNGDGVGLYSIGAGAQQISYVGGNTVTHNAFVGAYGEANFGSFQYIDVYHLGNTVNSNGTNYLFNSFGGSTQILN